MRIPRTLAAATIITGVTALLVMGRRWQLRWGTTTDEAEGTLAGDEILPRADLVATRAIRIRATADKVWPWIAQLGQGRGGFYSYDALENLIGCDIHSADRIVAKWQDIKVGDEIRLAPEVGLAVAAVDPERTLVLTSATRSGAAQQPYKVTWAFVIKEQPDATTRLLVRERYTYRRRWTPFVVEPLEAVDFLMTQRMLRGIRDRAERLPTPL
jgi:hypothetical protein